MLKLQGEKTLLFESPTPTSQQWTVDTSPQSQTILNCSRFQPIINKRHLILGVRGRYRPEMMSPDDLLITVSLSVQYVFRDYRLLFSINVHFSLPRMVKYRFRSLGNVLDRKQRRWLTVRSRFPVDVKYVFLVQHSPFRSYKSFFRSFIMAKFRFRLLGIVCDRKLLYHSIERQWFFSSCFTDIFRLSSTLSK